MNDEHKMAFILVFFGLCIAGLIGYGVISSDIRENKLKEKCMADHSTWAPMPNSNERYCNYNK